MPGLQHTCAIARPGTLGVARTLLCIYAFNILLLTWCQPTACLQGVGYVPYTIDPATGTVEIAGIGEFKVGVCGIVSGENVRRDELGFEGILALLLVEG